MKPRPRWLRRNLPVAAAISVVAALAVLVLMAWVGPLRAPFAGWFARWYEDHFGPTCSPSNANVYAAGSPHRRVSLPTTTTWEVRQGFLDSARVGVPPVEGTAPAGDDHHDAGPRDAATADDGRTPRLYGCGSPASGEH